MSGFQEIYEAYSKPVYRFLLSLTGEEVVAEELLQETFYRALLCIDRFEGRSSLFTWLCRIGKNAWLKEIQKSRKFMAPDALEGIASREPSPEEQTIREETYRDVREAVLKLGEPYRDVFILHAYADVKLKEIAVLYGKSESWARVTYYRARQQIVQEVSE